MMHQYRAPEILAAVEAFFATEPGVQESLPMPRHVADHMGIKKDYDETFQYHHTRADIATRERFDSQVKRAANRLTEEGALRKTPAHEQGPDGHWAGSGSSRFWTTAAWDAAVKKREQEQAAEAEQARRWNAAATFMNEQGEALLGIEERYGLSQYKPGSPFTLTLEGWERLRERLADSKPARDPAWEQNEFDRPHAPGDPW